LISYDQTTVLTSDYAALLAEEFNRKPIFNDEAAFDLYPPYAYLFTQRITFF
jgi:translation initiation factor IF-2